MYKILRGLRSLKRSVIHHTVNSIHYTVYSIHYTLSIQYSIQYTGYSIHYTLYIYIQYTVYRIPYNAADNL